MNPLKIALELFFTTPDQMDQSKISEALPKKLNIKMLSASLPLI